MKKLIAALVIATALPASATLSDTSGGRLSYVANGATTAYVFTFPAGAASDVTATVTLNGIAQVNPYAVTLNGDQVLSPGGTVTFNTAPANTATVTIRRTEPLTQGTVLNPYDRFPAKAVERTFDATVRKIQQVDGRVADLETKEMTDISNTIAGGVGAASLIAPVATGFPTAHTLADRFAYFPTIKDFGATCNGSASDNFAFTLAESSSVTDIYLPYNAVCVTTGLTLKKKYFGLGSLSVNGVIKFFGDVMSLRSFGAAGDGSTSDNAAFTAAEAAIPTDIYLPAGTYLATGINLKKRYFGPGTILLDGIKRYNGWSVDRGRALALDYVSKVKSLGMRSDKQSAITRRDANTLTAYRPLGGTYWQELTLSNGAVAAGPYSWNRTRIVQRLSYLALAYSASLTYTGAWGTLDSGDPALYVGGHAKFTSTPGDKIDYTFTGSGDLYVVYIGRTSGGYVRVDIDGATDNANSLPSGGTGNYRYIDTYNSVDLTYKTLQKVATGLAQGSHTVTLTLKADHNASNVSGTQKFYFNAIAAAGKEIGLPPQTNTQAPKWVTGATYVTDDWVQNAGNTYFATGGGVAGASAPTCTVGTCSDGTVTWQFSATSSYELNSETLQDAGSQLEYAIQHKPTGATTFQAMGGVVHGNETKTSISILSDGQNFGDIPIGLWVSADTVSVVQAINGTHPDTGATVIVSTKLTHRISSDAVTVFHSHTWNVADAVGWYYTAMWPLLVWGVPTGTPSFQYAFDNLFTPQGGKRLASAYYGQVNPIVGRSPDFYMQASGGVLMPGGSAGVASVTPPTFTAIAGLYVPPESLDEYRSANSLYAGMAMNLAGSTPPGFSSTVMKMYFERVSDSPTVSTAIGDVWTSEAVYYLTLVPDYPFDPN